MPKEPSEQKNALAGAGGGRFFRSRERHVWYAREGYGGANAIQSPKLVDYDLTKDSRHLSSCQMTHVLNSIANQWQILVHFSSFAMSIWRLFLGQFWHEVTRCRRTDSMVTPKNLS